MEKYFIIYILLLVENLVIAQNAILDKKRDYQWLFGYKYDKYTYDLMDFNAKPAQKMGIKAIGKGSLGDIANICDTSGRMLLHTNGCFLLDRNYNKVIGTDSLNKGDYKDAFCSPVPYGLTISQGSLFLPNNKNPNIYNLFHTTLDKGGYCNELMLSTISDSSEHPKALKINKKIIKDSLEYRITATRHANGKYWWVFMCNYTQDINNEDIYYRALVGDDTIQIYKQVFGKLPKKKARYYSKICFSPDGTKFARYREQDSLYIFDFDRTTGLVSNKRGVSTNQLDYYHGVVFSSDSRFVYALSDNDLFQIDTWEGNLESGKELIAIWDGFNTNGFSTSFNSGRLGPDCKIYVTSQGTTEYLTVINNPNIKGKNCGVEQHSLKFPTKISWELPNYPHFRLGAVGEKHTPCDSTINPYITATGNIKEEVSVTFAVYPNPAEDYVNVDLFGYVNRYERGTWALYNLAGQQVATFPLLQGHDEYVFDISTVPNGVYVWRVSFNGVPTSFSGKLVVLKE